MIDFSSEKYSGSTGLLAHEKISFPRVILELQTENRKLEKETPDYEKKYGEKSEEWGTSVIYRTTKS